MTRSAREHGPDQNRSEKRKGDDADGVIEYGSSQRDTFANGPAVIRDPPGRDSLPQGGVLGPESAFHPLWKVEASASWNDRQRRSADRDVATFA